MTAKLKHNILSDLWRHNRLSGSSLLVTMCSRCIHDNKVNMGFVFWF